MNQVATEEIIRAIGERDATEALVEPSVTNFYLGSPGRCAKPRLRGLTAIIDPGLPIGAFRDLIYSHKELVDAVKFGWGTALVTSILGEKIAILNDARIPFWFGGSLFERAYIENRTRSYIGWVRKTGASYFEISDGAIDLPLAERRSLIRELATEFSVLAEIGKKDSAVVPVAKDWIEAAHGDLDAGARWVVLEGRESGSAGLYERSGEIRKSLISELLASVVRVDDLFFEAPRTDQQAFFIKMVGGAGVNLANVATQDVVAVETLRRGLRSETLMDTCRRGQGRQGKAG